MVMGDVGVVLKREVQIPEENWERADEAARKIVNRIRPTVEADCKRKEVIEYVQALIKSSLGYEVFPYGSVPLKTYLPDGDIDLTAICSPAVEDALVTDVHAVLRREERSKDAPYEVKDVHCIDAEVKLIKCIVQNIVVDISFNQLGGLSTLCYLEQVDQIVGRNHLFKRSIILIKAWCYYESRILGAHHGLISTYALETLVLYILHVFHTSLSGPLAVLYKFLDYFSKFDWDNYCISINGPVCKSSLPNIVAEPPENGKDELLLSDEFLRKCVDMFSIPSRSPEINSRPFPLKHLNVVDSLKENNNLGRSVNRASFHRIQGAFKYGARILGRILSLPSEKMINELNKFFENTLDGHGRNYWSHVQKSCVVSGSGNSDNSSSSSFSDKSSEGSMLLKSTVDYSSDQLCETSCGENGNSENKISYGKMTDGEIGCTLRSESKENHFVVNNSTCSCANHEGKAALGSAIAILVNNTSAENLTPTIGERDFASISGNSQSFKSLLDLNGDYENHFRSVVFGQYCHFYAVSAPILLFPPMLPQSDNKNPWETVRQSLQLKQNVQSQMNKNGVSRQQRYSLNPPAPLSAAFNSEEKRKRRGTGTYIPSMSYHSNWDRLPSGRGKNQTAGGNGELHKHTHDNGLAATSQERNSSKSGHELSEAEYPYLGNGKPVPSEIRISQSSVWGSFNANGFSRLSERIDSGSEGLQRHEESMPERITPLYSGISCTWGSASIPVETAAEGSEPVLENEQERIAQNSYRLKDEVDFPPLFQGRAVGM
ncbi:hypothetical protein P3X46_022118 [Hevea brasiliensis]|uniref:Polymerase nucleotidyl transferase domain-containing protein n=1 Tax=Hevea brasiliensis TaxID=3981 RepID=A0ABQ9LHN3_HEVBR|nr:uncharacterized protein LOC110665174 [Hevea brasiliensis]KAJ9167467.1 hypothetical protein P3X46_022118 [Hevea brasiliensis]